MSKISLSAISSRLAALKKRKIPSRTANPYRKYFKRSTSIWGINVRTSIEDQLYLLFVGKNTPYSQQYYLQDF
ncbi:hypothetical protein HY382_02825 [Candidatus Curtissbacteria bacterium]|nr:hypothetical protein [Candidatus Curtissbacteria bacterium]